MIRSLDQKLAAIRAAPQTAKDFIIADAKDADMAFGARAPGPRSYLSAHGARPAQFSPEVWSREEYGCRHEVIVPPRNDCRTQLNTSEGA